MDPHTLPITASHWTESVSWDLGSCGEVTDRKFFNVVWTVWSVEFRYVNTFRLLLKDPFLRMFFLFRYVSTFLVIGFDNFEFFWAFPQLLIEGRSVMAWILETGNRINRRSHPNSLKNISTTLQTIITLKRFVGFKWCLGRCLRIFEGL